MNKKRNIENIDNSAPTMIVPNLGSPQTNANLNLPQNLPPAIPKKLRYGRINDPLNNGIASPFIFPQALNINTQLPQSQFNMVQPGIQRGNQPGIVPSFNQFALPQPGIQRGNQPGIVPSFNQFALPQAANNIGSSSSSSSQGVRPNFNNNLIRVNERRNLTNAEITNFEKFRRQAGYINNFITNRRSILRANFLGVVCSDSGECIAFGKEIKKIKEHFDGFTRFNYVTNCLRITQPSSNGIVDIITYERDGYEANAILKTSSANQQKHGDNLYYEYLVGQFLNRQSEFFPCFVETYGVFQYMNDITLGNFKLNPLQDCTRLNEILIQLPENNSQDIINDNFRLSCSASHRIAILVQYIKEAKTLKSMITNIAYKANFIRNELLYVLYQIYFPISVMRNNFTHYDLHWENILLYEPNQNGYIQYNYFTRRDSPIPNSFKSSYIVKIIDYGRCYYEESNLRPDYEIDLQSSLKIFEKLCITNQCDPYCGFRKGYNYLHHVNLRRDHQIVSSRKNESHDLRLLSILQSVIKDGVSVLSDINTYNSTLGTFISGVKYDSMYGTEERASVNYRPPNFVINNTVDAIKVIHAFIKLEVNRNNNNQTYANKIKIGEMYIYGDGTPMRYIPTP